MLRHSALWLVLSGCAGEGEPSVCLPVPVAPAAPVVEAQEARLFWDNSGSMARFYKKDGPYAKIGLAMESSVLPSVNLFRFSHAYVDEHVTAAANYHEPDFKGNATDLLTVAEQMASFVNPAAPGVALLVSDLLVATPPEQRSVPNAMACGATLPQNGWAPFHFSACLEHGMGAPPVDGQNAPPAGHLFVSAIRIPAKDSAMFVLVMSRSAALGRSVAAKVQGVVADSGPTQLVLIDTEQAGASATVGACTSSAEDVVFMGRTDPEAPEACRFRHLNPTDAPNHVLACSLTGNVHDTGLIRLEPGAVAVGDATSPVGPNGEYLVTIPHNPEGGDVALQVANRFVAPQDQPLDEALVAFLHPATDPPTPVTESEAHVKDVLTGLVRVLARRPAPVGPAWTVQYDN